jgi:hypothetical protein
MAMGNYKCFLVDRDGHLLDVRFADWPHDAQARDWAATLRLRDRDCGDVELWDQERLIWRSGAAT